jgi:tRNA nucleotidyltransferase (CCA-adding enzyme)
MLFKEYIDYFIQNLIKIDNPSILLDMIFDNNLSVNFPEINNLRNCQQDPIWHPEGDVYIHTKMVLEKAKEISLSFENDYDKTKILLFAICHDLGKPSTTVFSNGRWRSPGHEMAGIPISRDFLSKFGYDEKLISEILILVKEHLSLIHLYKDKDKVSDKAIIRLVQRIDLNFLIPCVKSDYFGRTNLTESIDDFEPEKWVFERLNQVKVNKKKTTFLNGKTLLLLGLKPGKQIGDILREAEKLENQNIINSQEQAIEWVKTKL